MSATRLALNSLLKDLELELELSAGNQSLEGFRIDVVAYRALLPSSPASTAAQQLLQSAQLALIHVKESRSGLVDEKNSRLDAIRKDMKSAFDNIANTSDSQDILRFLGVELDTQGPEECREIGSMWANENRERQDLSTQLAAVLWLAEFSRLSSIPIYKTIHERWIGSSVEDSLVWRKVLMTQERATYTFYGTKRGEMVTVVNSIIGSHILESTTYRNACPFKVRRSRGQKEPICTIQTEPFIAALEQLRKKNNYAKIVDRHQTQSALPVLESDLDDITLKRWSVTDERRRQILLDIEAGVWNPLMSTAIGITAIRELLDHLETIIMLCRLCGITWKMADFEWPIIAMEFPAFVQQGLDVDTELIGLPASDSIWTELQDIDALRQISSRSLIVPLLGKLDISDIASTDRSRDLLLHLRITNAQIAELLIVENLWQPSIQDQSIRTAVALLTDVGYHKGSFAGTFSPQKTVARSMLKKITAEKLKDEYSDWTQDLDLREQLVVLCERNEKKIQKITSDGARFLEWLQDLTEDYIEEPEEPSQDHLTLQERVATVWYKLFTAKMDTTTLQSIHRALRLFSYPLNFCRQVSELNAFDSFDQYDQLLDWQFSLASRMRDSSVRVLHEFQELAEKLQNPSKDPLRERSEFVVGSTIRSWKEPLELEASPFSRYIPPQDTTPWSIVVPKHDLHTFLGSIQASSAGSFDHHAKQQIHLMEDLFNTLFNRYFLHLHDMINRTAKGHRLPNPTLLPFKIANQNTIGAPVIRESEILPDIRILSTKYNREIAIDRSVQWFDDVGLTIVPMWMKRFFATIFVSLTLPIWRKYDGRIDYLIPRRVLQDSLETSAIPAWFRELLTEGETSCRAILEPYIQEADVIVETVKGMERDAFEREAADLRALPAQQKDELGHFSRVTALITGAIDQILKPN